MTNHSGARERKESHFCVTLIQALQRNGASTTKQESVSGRQQQNEKMRERIKEGANERTSQREKETGRGTERGRGGGKSATLKERA